MARAKTKRSVGRKPTRSRSRRKPSQMQSDQNYQRWYFWKVYDLAQTIWREIDPELQYMAIQTVVERRVKAKALQTQLAEQAAARAELEDKQGWGQGRNEPLVAPILQPILQPPTIRSPSRLARLRQKKQNLLQQLWSSGRGEAQSNG